MALLPSDVQAVGPYRLEGRLGVGGQGTVYVGCTASGQRVAIKLLHPHLIMDMKARARFLSEVEIAKRVALFCTAKVLDSGFVNEQPYIVSEFVDGPSLQESVRDTGPRNGAALERLALNTATALAAIHQADVVHRDFKPGNVLLGPDGPVVIDFGIARALDLSTSIVTSQAVGSPGYMAPEQIAGDELGPPADLFAWGATMVYAATGKRAFSGETIPAVIRSILHDQPNLHGLDGRLGVIVRACLEKDPALRPTAAEVVDRLRGLPGPAWHTGGEPGDGADRGDGEGRAPAEKGRLRHVVLVGAVALALIAALGIAYFALPSGPGEEHFDASGVPGSSPPPGGASASSSPPYGGTSASSSPTGVKASRTESPSARPGKDPTAGTERHNPRPSEHAPNPTTTKPSATRKPPSPTNVEKSPSDRGTPPPSDEQQQPRPSGPKQSHSGPKVLGTVSLSDVNRYCQDRGYAGSAGGPGNYWCFGPGGEPVSMTSVCQWAYPDYPNVRAEGTTCKSS
ncbi:serine/threonine protein kinase [Sphaerisporangium fuscum]|uniref:serine/threonine protein kinase n=1 Tax=Sphaerisporangium fuscum TaxID=2835868 RepID=UPI001BDBC5F3|nr:serine/threonine-protein kinase [Sphaerisporangium fuscum]